MSFDFNRSNIEHYLYMIAKEYKKANKANPEGEGFVTISYIEAYCETLFKIYEELNGIYTDEVKFIRV